MGDIAAEAAITEREAHQSKEEHEQIKAREEEKEC